MDFKITTDGLVGQMTWDDETTIMNNIYLSLMVPRGAFFAAPQFGSRLHEITKTTAQSVALLKDYCKEAMQWLLDLGRARSIEVKTERDARDLNRINMRITVTQADGRVITFETFTRVV